MTGVTLPEKVLDRIQSEGLNRNRGLRNRIEDKSCNVEQEFGLPTIIGNP